MHLWSDERNAVRRVLDAELKSRVLQLSVLRFGQSQPVVNDRVIVGPKCARTIESAQEAQLLYYLKTTGFEVGLLLNFGHKP